MSSFKTGFFGLPILIPRQLQLDKHWCHPKAEAIFGA
jgi:hypothetical protein